MRFGVSTLLTPFEVSLRMQTIVFVVYRHGLAGTLASIGVEITRSGLRFVSRRPDARPRIDKAFGASLATTLARLGPTFIKLGQILATRPDIVGEVVADELKLLFDRVPPISFREIQKILRAELGKKKLAEGFSEIDPVPLASASLSQTHRARLADGTPVILKIQKTGTEKKVRTDLQIIEAFVRSVHTVYPALQLRNIFEDFKTATLGEIDYRLEAKNIDRFQKNYRGLFSRSDILFPRYFEEYSTGRVLALEPMRGRRFVELRKGSTVARVAAGVTLSAVLEQIFDHGFFHADPHAGNLFFLEEEGRVGFIDLGLVGRLEPEDKRRFLKVLTAILQRDKNKLAKSLYELGQPSPKTDYSAFELDVNTLIDELGKQGLDKLQIEPAIARLLQIGRKHALYIPNRYILMIRSCLVVEGLARSLDPKISVAQVAAPIIARGLARSYSPFNYFKRRGD